MTPDGRRANRVAVDRRADPGALPMGGDRVDGQPEHPVVLEGPGREADLFRHGIATLGRQLIEPILNLLPRARFVRVTGVRTDDVLERQAFVEHRGCHGVSRLLLAVVRAGVRHNGQVERVQRVVGRVVEMPECLLDGILRLPLELPPEEDTCLGETGARRRCHPSIRVVHGERPCRRAAHRETSHDEAVGIDRIGFRDRFDRFEGVNFAREPAGIGVAAVRLKHEPIGAGRKGLRSVAGRRLRHELLLENGIVATVHEDVEPILPLRRAVVISRHRQDVWLCRAVDS